MTKIKLNPLVVEMRGKLGKIVFKKSKSGQTYIATLPEKSKDRPSKAQLAQRQAFAKAASYANAALEDETSRAFYEALARRRKTIARALCTGDYLNAPTIANLDVSGYQGQVGDRILITAHDDIGVVEVNVQLTGSDGTPIESGKAVELGAGSKYWEYVATVQVSLGKDIFISVRAFDRPRNKTVVSTNLIVGESH